MAGKWMTSGFTLLEVRVRVGMFCTAAAWFVCIIVHSTVLCDTRTVVGSS